MSFLRVSLLFFTASLLFFSVQFAGVSSLKWDPKNQDNIAIFIKSCKEKGAEFNKLLVKDTMKIGDDEHESIGNMMVFYEKCVDYSNCLENIPLPEVAIKEPIKLMSAEIKFFCNLLEINLGPFGRCLVKTKFDVKTLRNTVIDQETPDCELTDEEFGNLEAIVGQRCDEEAWDDMEDNEERVRRILC